MWSKNAVLAIVLLLAASFSVSTAGAALVETGSQSLTSASADDDLVFIHHSVGANWLNTGLEAELLAKLYVDERNDISYGTVMSPDAGRPVSLGAVPGDLTNMNHWILWFNDYLEGVKVHGSASGYNRIVMFKSCYPISNVWGDGSEPGDPFSSEQTLANYKAVYRHPTGGEYSHNGQTYYALEDIFAANPDVLFIAVAAPPLHYAPTDATNDANAHRARLFNNWLKNDWLSAYNAAHPGLDNVAVFDLFNVLAYADNDSDHPNRLRQEYGGDTGDSHPNEAGSDAATVAFAGEGAFLDIAWEAFVDTEPPISRPFRQYIPLCTQNPLDDGARLLDALFDRIFLKPPWLFCPYTLAFSPVLSIRHWR